MTGLSHYTGAARSAGGLPSGCVRRATSRQVAPLGPGLGMNQDLNTGRSNTQ